MTSHARSAALVAALLLLALHILLVTSLPVAAEPDVSFGDPGASGVFGETVTFNTTFTSSQTPLRVELLTRRPGDHTDHVSFASFEPAGNRSWRAVARQGGHIVPNTSWDYRFRVVTPDGAATGPTATHRLVDASVEWQKLAGDRVDVWWHEGGSDVGRRALDVAETALASASELLGVGEMEPVDFFIYSDAEEFRRAMGPATRENVGGQAHPDIRTLFGLIEPRQIGSDWVEELVTHELAHLVFDEAVANPYQYPPRWLNEGLAVYLSRGYTARDRRQVEGAAGGGTIIPLEGLGGQFPTRSNRISLAYAESVSAVDYFVETYGEDQLVQLITSFAEGTGLDGAFVASTGEDFATFDAAWLQSVGSAYPEPYGPLEGEPGAVPDAWVSESSALLG